MTALHPDFLRRPIAHRGLHSDGIPENSMAAFDAAIAAGYGIECDIQATADGQAVVFRDYDLSRLADDAGFVADLHRQRLQEFRLLGSDEQIPTLRGMSPWILKDFRSPRREHPVFQNGWNRKGIVSELGVRKQAFGVLADYYRKK